MSIRINTNKTTVNGVRGREILSIKALSSKCLPEEYLSLDGAVYRTSLQGAKYTCLHILRRASGSDVLVPHAFLKTGLWLSEKTFQAKREAIIRAGNQLTAINKRQLKEWYGDEVVVVSAIGVVETDTIKGFDEIERLIYTYSNDKWGESVLHKLQELGHSDGHVRIWLLTSKVGKSQKNRILRDTAVVECGGATSVESCQTVSRLLMKILMAIGRPDHVVTEEQFQKVIARLKRAIQKVERRSWQGMELIKI